MGIKSALINIVAAAGDNTVGGVVNTATAGLQENIWAVIPGGLLVWGIIFGLRKAKQAAKTAAS